jgi:hypothetical protein
MAMRVQDQLQSIEELSAHGSSIPKACTVGVVIDATNAYFDEGKTKFVKKIKLVDDSFNTHKYSPHQKYPYLTVFFYAPKLEDLPNPRFIGDVLYLRRFSFGRYNESFQGHFLEAQYCSWALLAGEGNETNQYQASRMDMNLSEEKYAGVLSRVRQLQKFAREYLSTTSILSILPTGIVPKDTDLIVKVVKRSEEGFRLTNGREELLLGETVSLASEGSIAKLRSVARIARQDKQAVIVPNNFTSLIALREWSYDSQKFAKAYAFAMELEQDKDIYTSLAQLNSLPIGTPLPTQPSARTRSTT